jgi:hypothetical protein
MREVMVWYLVGVRDLDQLDEDREAASSSGGGGGGLAGEVYEHGECDINLT